MASFKLAAGRLELEPFSLTAGELRFDGDGSIGMDGELDLEVTLSARAGEVSLRGVPQDLVQLMTVEGGRLSGFLEVSRALGDLDAQADCKPAGLSAAPELRTQPLEPDDEFVLLASDGLWRLLDSQAAVGLARSDLRAHADVAMAAEKLVDGALHTRRAEDNITVLVLLLRPVAPDAAIPQRPRLKLMKRGTSVPTSLMTAAGLMPKV